MLDMEYDMISIDFETHLIGQPDYYPKPICLSWYDGKDTGLIVGMSNMEQFLISKLETETIIAHNATFECGVIYHHFPNLIENMFKALEEDRIICTMIQEQIINITREKGIKSFSLANLVKNYLKIDISDTKGADAWRLRYNELETIPLDLWPKAAKDYAIDDSIYAYNIYKLQNKADGHLSLKSSVYLNVMASFGMKLDLNRVNQLDKEVRAHLQPYYDFLISKDYCYITKKNKVSKRSKKFKEHLESLNLELKYTIKEGIATDGEAMEFYRSQTDDPIISAFSSLAEYEKVISAYLSNMSNVDTLYTQYSTVKNTGRTSSNKSKFYPSMNIQQMPRSVPNVSYDIRNCFVPRSGMKIVSIDYAGLELAATAHQLFKVYKRSAMKDMINSGDSPVDLHSKLAAQIKKVTYEHFMENKAEYKAARQLAKPINLGFPGGIGYDTMRHLLWRDGIKTRFNILHTENNENALKYFYFQMRQESDNIRICRTGKKEWALVEDELVSLKRAFYDLYPELEMFLKDGHNRYITDKFKWQMNDYGEWEKEPMYSYDVNGFKRDYCTYTAFCNGFLMQTPSAVGAKKAVSRVVRTFHEHPDIKPLAFIHDEILFECKEHRKDLVEDAANIMIEEMQSVFSSVRITVEASMSDYWQKADGFWTKQMWRNA
jgi:DNA polymerase I-like protein with 3'-5' exonuclease and polymerase domains